MCLILVGHIKISNIRAGEDGINLGNMLKY